MKTQSDKNTKMPSRRNWGGLGTASVAVVLLMGMTGCGTNSPHTRPSTGVAMIDSRPIPRHRDRIKGMRIISVNGKPGVRREAMIAAGLNTVRVRYDWPQGGSQEVSLRFKARPNVRYSVKYDPFPPTTDQFRGTTELSLAADALGAEAFRLMELRGGELAGLVVLTPAIVLGTANYADRIRETAREKFQAAHYVDLMVISEHNAEGVVRRVRAYPSGRVVSKPWEAYSNAPIGVPRRETTPRRSPHAEVESILPRH